MDEEEEKLKAMIGDGEPRGKWAEIAAQMGNERSAMSVEQHWCDGGPARRFPPRGALCLHRDIAMNALAVPLAMSPLSPFRLLPAYTRTSHARPPCAHASLPRRQIMMGKRKKHQSIKKSNGGGGDVGGLDGSAMVVVTMGDGSMGDPASSLTES